MKVYTAIAKVAAKLAKDGISKARKNEQQGYKFRGIDDVYNALAPYLAEEGLCILPNVMEREVVERINHKGTALFYVTVKVQFDFVCAEDGSKHAVVTFGEAMDSGDKATNKAMSAAYKYAAMQAFCIPTEGDNDADATTHEVKARQADAEGKQALEACKSLDALADVWRTLTPAQRSTLGTVKDAMKTKLMQAEEATQA
jgi:ERF superfamily